MTRCLSVCLCAPVCRKSVFCLNDWTDTEAFLDLCNTVFIRKFGHLQNKGSSLCKLSYTVNRKFVHGIRASQHVVDLDKGESSMWWTGDRRRSNYVDDACDGRRLTDDLRQFITLSVHIWAGLLVTSLFTPDAATRSDARRPVLTNLYRVGQKVSCYTVTDISKAGQ